MKLELDAAAIFEGVDFPNISLEPLILDDMAQSFSGSQDSSYTSQESCEKESQTIDEPDTQNIESNFGDTSPEGFCGNFEPLASNETTSNNEQEIINKQGVINNNNNITMVQNSVRSAVCTIAESNFFSMLLCLSSILLSLTFIGFSFSLNFLFNKRI